MSRAGFMPIDVGTAAGRRAADRLGHERVAWMTTVNGDGTPQTSPIWFVVDDGGILVYSLESPRVENVRSRPRVSLNLDGNGKGGDIVIVEGTAHIDEVAPPASENARYLEKYKPVMDEYGWTPEWFASRYRVPVRIEPTRFRYW